MNEYLSKEYIAKLLDSHLADSRGAEHYAYDIIKRELMDAHDVVIEPFDFETVYAKQPLEIDEYSFCCPACEKELGLTRQDIFFWGTDTPNYCSYCGQQLDWSKVKNYE